MDADAGPDVGVRFGDGKNIVPFAFARRDVEHGGDAARTGAFEHFILLFGEALIVEVAVRIDEHSGLPFPPIVLGWQFQAWEDRYGLADHKAAGNELREPVVVCQRVKIARVVGDAHLVE